MGLPPTDLTPLGGQCTDCTRATTRDNWGLHGLTCTHAGAGNERGARTDMHATCKYAFIAALNDLAKQAGCPGVVGKNEPHCNDYWQKQPPKPPAPGALPPPPVDVRADILITFPGKATFLLDLTFVHPSVAKSPRVATEPGFAAALAAKGKDAHYHSKYIIDPVVANFVPIAVETGGRMAPQVRQFCNHFVRLLIDKDVWGPAETAWHSYAMRHLLESLGAAVATAVGGTLLLKGRAQTAAGAAPQPGAAAGTMAQPAAAPAQPAAAPGNMPTAAPAAAQQVAAPPPAAATLAAAGDGTAAP